MSFAKTLRCLDLCYDILKLYLQLESFHSVMDYFMILILGIIFKLKTFLGILT